MVPKIVLWIAIFSPSAADASNKLAGGCLSVLASSGVPSPILLIVFGTPDGWFERSVNRQVVESDWIFTAYDLVLSWSGDLLPVIGPSGRLQYSGP